MLVGTVQPLNLPSVTFPAGDLPREQPSPHRLGLPRRWLLHPAEQCVLDPVLLREGVPKPTSAAEGVRLQPGLFGKVAGD